jgi:uncharacterized membrane protein YfcA
MIPTLAQGALAVGSGALVGVSLGLVGGGGSILAVPLLYYVVGLASPHAAIGTGAAAVATTAAMGLAGHARAGTVKWPCALAFAASGVVGAAAGAAIGKAVDGERLLALFGLLMIAVGVLMTTRWGSGGTADVRLTRQSAPQLLPLLAVTGLAVGFASGFFGIGGGFLIVPGLVGATAMPILNAVGSSLVSVTAFGATTAASYAWSGLVVWPVALLFVLGGLAGSQAGMHLARQLSADRRTLSRVFAILVIAAGLYVAIKGLDAWIATSP